MPSKPPRWRWPPPIRAVPAAPAINKYVAPRALLWFRWSALGTWLLGRVVAVANPRPLHQRLYVRVCCEQPAPRPTVIMGIGAWLGTIMLFNVWGLIWPNQKKILGLVPATDEQKAAARKVALYASRMNFLLSIPMLMCMVGPIARTAVLTTMRYRARSVPVPADLPQQVAARAGRGRRRRRSDGGADSARIAPAAPP